MPWKSPSLSVKWGPYFREEPEDQQKVVGLVREALGGSGESLITLRKALERIGPIFGIENIDAALDALEEQKGKRDSEQEERDAKELEAALKELGANALPGKDRDSGRAEGGKDDARQSPQEAGDKS